MLENLGAKASRWRSERPPSLPRRRKAARRGALPLSHRMASPLPRSISEANQAPGFAIARDHYRRRGPLRACRCTIPNAMLLQHVVTILSTDVRVLRISTVCLHILCSHESSDALSIPLQAVSERALYTPKVTARATGSSSNTTSRARQLQEWTDAENPRPYTATLARSI